MALKIESPSDFFQPTKYVGGTLTVSKDGDSWAVTDSKGNTAHVTIGDVIQSNGVIHVVDKVLMP